LYYTSRTIQVLRTIRILLNNDESGIILSLCRNLFECYVHLVFLNRRPGLAKDLALPAMVDNKKYEFLRTASGRKERKKVRDLQTGKVTRVYYSIREMLQCCRAKREEQLYDAWYPFLSYETHFTAELMGELYNGLKFNVHREEDHAFELINLGFALALVTEEIGKFKMLDSANRRDINYGTRQLARALGTFSRVILPHARKRDRSDHYVVFREMNALSKRVLRVKSRRGANAPIAKDAVQER
jgi:hypothetical protein